MEPVAVVGMGALFPGAPDLDAYWRNLVGGVDCITGVPEDYGLDGFPGARGGFLGDLATVDVAGLGLMPAALPSTEPDQLLALHVAKAAIADAGDLGDHARVGVILGRGGYLTAGLSQIDLRTNVARQLVTTLGELLPDLGPAELDRVRTAFLDRLGPESPGSEIGHVPNLAASRIANRLGFGGPAYTVDAACASSLIAIDHAVNELAGGRCDAVLAGGVHHGHDATLWTVFARLGALSRTAGIRPLSGNADGLLIGEGTGIVVLKRLSDARAAGDRVYAVVRGTGVASDGGGVSLMHPASGGQVLAVRRAWDAAGLDPAAPDSVGLIEAHGTATREGDAAEVATLRDVFGPGEPAVVGSVKSMIGHTMPAAGIAGFIKAALAVHHGVLPPTLHCETPHPGLAGTRFRPIAEAQPWTGTRRAAVNAFGFGGISAHVVLEQESSPVVVRTPTRVLRIAANSAGELAELLNAGRSVGSGPVRMSIVDPDERKIATAHRVLVAGKPWRGRGDIWFSPAPLLPEGKIAFLYPGLEAQFSAEVETVARRFGFAAPELSTHTLGRHGAAVSDVGRMMDAAVRMLGILPDAVAGHSIGEWSAMTSAGMYDEDELSAVLDTFDLDNFPVPDVVFATLGAPAERVEPRLTGDLTLSHDNSPNQCVVCGPADQVRALLAELLDERVLGQELPFRSGFHTPALRPYVGRIENGLGKHVLRPPAVPIWSATIAAPYPDDIDEVRELFTRHLLEPVRFRPMIEAMYAAGFRVFVQVGPGQLHTLVSDVLAGRDHLAVAASSTRHDGIGQLTRVAAAVWADGGAVRDELWPPLPLTPTRLRLGRPLVSLGPDAPALIGSVRAEPARPDRVAAFLRDTEQAVADVLAAARVTGGHQEHEMSLRTMPYLRDHSFYDLPAGWPDAHDGFPVVPATELVRQLMAAAERAMPGMRAIAVHDARFERWLAVEPAVRVRFEITPVGPRRIRVTAKGHAQAEIELAAGYPGDRPVPWTLPADREPLLTGEEMYRRRWMFHGPAYQGVSEISGIGDRHVHGVITVPDAPGSLLDNAGHFVGYWVMEEFEENCWTFPKRFGHIRFFSDPPRPGDKVVCQARLVSVTGTSVEAELLLVRDDGTVWAHATGWQLHRFACTPRVRAMKENMGTAMIAHDRDGWYWVGETWPDLATRELMARMYLTRAEQADYQSQPPTARRGWLLGRITAKDAARAWLLASGRAEVFPAELEVGSGVVTERFGARSTVDVTVEQCREVAVALTGPGRITVLDTEPSLAELGPEVRLERLWHNDREYFVAWTRESGR
ncbi:polyketide synthase [Lentzea sp. NBRC 105346]|uniref:beta-ketoacyl synthase N-terminal-like domain-containing protein n=1 Tax=Lentzea sp. NBRC 105346 TaxID=3032205 RepID=UPI0024A0369F|nr:beta-ketoacyl synthase N-terminal-like domain-containing protein [Lentzea sp. NBRC 105346]GLZ35965.1 polyketide synthase [Lentzea sp. NBRC 105346]